MSEDNVNTGFDAMFHSVCEITKSDTAKTHNITTSFLNIIKMQNDILKEELQEKNNLIRFLADKLVEKDQG